MIKVRFYTLKPECILHLQRDYLGCGDEGVAVPVPPLVQHKKEVAAGLEIPPQTAVEAQGPGKVVVLEQVGPGKLRGQVDLCPEAIDWSFAVFKRRAASAVAVPGFSS